MPKITVLLCDASEAVLSGFLTCGLFIGGLVHAQSASVPAYPASAVLADARELRDLAAQEEMARWARWQLILSAAALVVSAGGLVALLRSLALTRDATRSARDAVEVAKLDHEAQSRAWLSVDCVLNTLGWVPVHDDERGAGFTLTITVVNHGASPATSVRVDATMGIAPPDVSARTRLHELSDQRRRELDTNSGDAIFPGVSKVFTHRLILPAKTFESELKDGGFIAPYVCGCVTYLSAGTSTVRQSKFFHFVGEVGADGCGQALKPSDPDWLRESVLLMRPGTFLAD